MAVAIIIDEAWEVANCLQWAGRFARANDEPLTVLVLIEKQGGEAQISEPSEESEAANPVSQAVFELVEESPGLTRNEAESSETGETFVSIVELIGDDPAAAILASLHPRGVSLLVIPRHATDRGLDQELDWERDTFLRAPCETMLLRPAAEPQEGPHKLLVPVDGRPPSEAAIRWASRLAESEDAAVTALYVEPNVDEYAADVGEKIVRRILRRGQSEVKISKQVVIGSSVKESIAEKSADFSLLLVGANRQGIGQRWRRKSISEWLMARSSGPTVAVLRPAMPLTGRISRLIDQLLKARVPQLDREQRVSLVERVQGSSQWNFDFISLICLSTLIAALGLVQDSPAVVIGAMLVAPLMTPLVAAGLSLVQGNRLLIRRAGATVLRGFALAFAIGLITGWVIPRLDESHEMLARGSPTVLDFIVALVSGVAAAYAMGRPNLLSALPGVAIAAALVPPVATAGLAMALANYSLAFGALLLFVTNIVAIVLGTAAVLWAVGIRPMHEHGVLDSWVVRLSGVLLLLGLAITAYELAPQGTIPRAMVAELNKSAGAKDIELIETLRSSPQQIRLVVAAAAPIEQAAAAELGRIARRHLGAETEVLVETRLLTSVKFQP